MRQAFHDLALSTHGQGLYDITAAVTRFVQDSGINDGLLTAFIRHTSASLVIQENADPDVIADLNDFFKRLVAEDMRLYRHTSEGPDDMPAHIRSALTQTSLSIPVRHGKLTLGAWQGIYVFEHRREGSRRMVSLHMIGA